MDKIVEDINILSEEVQDVLSEPPKSIIKWGNTLLLLFLFVMMLLSMIIRYPDTINAQMVLTTTFPIQKEYAKAPGRIDRLFVHDFQKVSPGTPLALFENSANYSDVRILMNILDTVNLNSRGLIYSLEGFPPLSLGEVGLAYSNFRSKFVSYKLNIDSNTFKYDDDTHAYAIVQLKLRLEAFLNQKHIYDKEHEIKNSNLERLEKLYRKGVISSQELENEKLEYLGFRRNYEQLLISISEIKENLNMSMNYKEQNTIKYSNDNLSLFSELLQSLEELRKALNEWKIKYLIESQINGTVSLINVWSSNQSVLAEELVLTVIPNTTSKYVARIQAPSQNSGKIKIGQKVNIKLFGYPKKEFGFLEGEISKISLTTNDENQYIIEVSVPNDLITTFERKINFRQEMRGEAEIITDDLSLSERLLYGFNQVFDNY